MTAATPPPLFEILSSTAAILGGASTIKQPTHSRRRSFVASSALCGLSGAASRKFYNVIPCTIVPLHSAPLLSTGGKTLPRLHPCRLFRSITLHSITQRFGDNYL
jgi:hypothetical protein